ncbi:ribosomal protein L7/L12 [Streptomyces racemochromogenes]|uniref:Ribosomal protein L7/L12 n=1 Tax=Streptomyces racemochromogenes TaxID=67353 RepID=A0ABW7PPA9_9ACTN
MNTLYLLLALLAVAGWITSTVNVRMRALQDRADRLERRLGLVLDHLGIEEPEPAGLDAVRALMREGRTVSAIKTYREITGAGLAEAKKAVESLDPAPQDR